MAISYMFYVSDLINVCIIGMYGKLDIFESNTDFVYIECNVFSDYTDYISMWRKYPMAIIYNALPAVDTFFFIRFVYNCYSDYTISCHFGRLFEQYN